MKSFLISIELDKIMQAIFILCNVVIVTRCHETAAFYTKLIFGFGSLEVVHRVSTEYINIWYA